MPFDNVSFILEKHWINFAPENFYLLFCSFFFIIIILYDIIYYVATKINLRVPVECNIRPRTAPAAIFYYYGAGVTIGNLVSLP